MSDKTWPPRWTLKPVHGEPHTMQERDENDQPLPEFIHWDIGFGTALNIGADDSEGSTAPLTISAHFSDDDLARGFVKRQVTPEQLEEFARLLLNVSATYKRTAATR